jgi:glycosyltransferase involved in cell wall biosynthesis
VVAYPAGNRFHQELTQEMIEIRASQEGPLKILFLGNVIPRKGLHILLKALVEIVDKDWYLSVVGSLDFDPEYVKRIMQVVHGSGFAKKVMFFGPLQEDQLKEVMLNCQILAMPSYHEGFGIAYLEGMGFGLPAIGTTSGGASEIITHEVNGFLLPREDAPVLGENIARLIDDRKLLTRISLAALERFNQHPPWDDSMSRVRSFLDKIIQQDE